MIPPLKIILFLVESMIFFYAFLGKFKVYIVDERKVYNGFYVLCNHYFTGDNNHLWYRIHHTLLHQE